MNSSLRQLARVSVFSLSTACGLALAAGPAAAETGWVATRTQAFLPAPTAAVQVAGVRQDTALLDASREAVELPATASRHLVLALAPAATSAQVQAVVQYLQQQGFTGVKATPSQRLVEATGTAGSIKAAFRTTLKQFAYQGREVYANDAPAQVPQALGGTVQAVLGLQDVAVARAFHEVAAATGPSTPAATPLSADQPWQRDANGSPIPIELTPHQLGSFARLYDADLLRPATDRTVAIIASGDLSATLADLKAAMGGGVVPKAASISVVRTDQGDYKDDPENDIAWTTDSEALLAAAGGVERLVFYNPSDLSDANLLLALDKIAEDANGGMAGAAFPVVLAPFGMWEGDAHRSGFMSAFDAIVDDPHGAPQYVAPAGDDGAYARTRGIVRNAAGEWLVEPEDYSVNFPASSPLVDAIGGTSLYTNATGSGRDDGSYAWETVWNAGLAPVDPSNPDSDRRLHAGGGGISRYEPSRYLHTLPDQPNRVLPDFAFDADSASGALIYRHNSTATLQVGGTGLAAALYAGLALRVGIGGGTGEIPGLLDDIVAFDRDHNTGYSREQLLRPVNTGSNGYDGYGYQAVVGYDGTSGWGSLDALYLARALSALPVGNP